MKHVPHANHLFFFARCFGALVAGQAGSLPPIQIHYRKTETLYVVPQPDRIIIIFAVDFVDHTDVAIAKVFLQVVEAPESLHTFASM